MGRVAGASACTPPGAPGSQIERTAAAGAHPREGQAASASTEHEEITIDIGSPAIPERDRTVSEVGEFGVIDRATRDRPQSLSTLVGPGDDSALIVAPDGRVAATTDMLVQDRHFRLDWSTPEQIGRKAIAQNGADIAAMGARCTGFLVALGCPADTPVAVTDGLTDGFWREATRAGASIIGGDLVQTPMLVISITALGDLGGHDPVLRSGAMPGDVVAYCGRLGWSGAGLAVLQSGSGGHNAVVDAHRVPQPMYSAAVEAARAGATSLTDVSDGLLADLTHIADASAVSMDVCSAHISISPELISAATELGMDPMEWVLAGGEDHAFAATFPSDVSLPEGWHGIGVVGDSASAGRVTVDGEQRRGGRGWVSFQA